MFNYKSYSIKLKLIIIFIVFKVFPLFLLAYIGVKSFTEIDSLLRSSSESIIDRSQVSIKNTTSTAIKESIKALDEKSKLNLENKTVMLANEIANFLKTVDNDILFLSKLNINQKILKKFYAQKTKDIYLPAKYYYDTNSNKWVTKSNSTQNIVSMQSSIEDNSNEFHKTKN